jgi:hypothetical protein
LLHASALVFPQSLQSVFRRRILNKSFAHLLLCLWSGLQSRPHFIFRCENQQEDDEDNSEDAKDTSENENMDLDGNDETTAVINEYSELWLCANQFLEYRLSNGSAICH